MATFFQLGSWIVVQDYSDGVIVVEEKDDSPDEHFGSDGDNVGSDEPISVSSYCICPGVFFSAASYTLATAEKVSPASEG